MHTAIVEFDALADAVRAATQNHHLAFVGRTPFIVTAIVGRVEVRSVGFELRGARVHNAIARNDAKLLARGPHFVFRLPNEIGDLPVGKTERLGFLKQFRSHGAAKSGKVSLSVSWLTSIA